MESGIFEAGSCHGSVGRKNFRILSNSCGGSEKIIQDCTYLQVDSTKTFPDMEPALYQKAIEEYKAGTDFVSEARHRE